MIKILVVDDQEMFLQGIVMILKEYPTISIVGTARDGVQALEFIKKNPKTDIVLMDINMPNLNGVDATKKIKESNSYVKVLILTMDNSEDSFKNSLRAGADGFITKDCQPEHLLEAIQNVNSGNRYLSSNATEMLIEIFKRNHFSNNQSSLIKPNLTLFTEREINILELICLEKTGEEISNELKISRRTVEVHKSNMMLKTGTKNLVGLLVFAIKNGYLSLNESINRQLPLSPQNLIE